MLVVITKSYISKLASAIRYDKLEREKPKHLDVEWFDLKQHQFDLISKMAQFLFGNDHIYSVIEDTYFDDTHLFEINMIFNDIVKIVRIICIFYLITCWYF